MSEYAYHIYASSTHCFCSAVYIVYEFTGACLLPKLCRVHRHAQLFDGIAHDSARNAGARIYSAVVNILYLCM